MKLHLIRHGATATSGLTYAGRSDVPLTARGHAQAHLIAMTLAARPLWRILSSPLSRARATARPLALAQGMTVETDPRLMEFDFGRHAGQPKHSLTLCLRRDHMRTPVPDGEALADAWHRAGRFLAELAVSPHPPDAECAVIGHYWINRMLQGHVAGQGFEATCRARDYRPETGSLVTLDLDPACLAATPAGVHRQTTPSGASNP